MIKFVLISAIVAGASAGYASSQYAGAGTSAGLYNQLNTGQNAYADKYPYTNTGYNGGFTSQYAGPNGVGAAAGAGSGAFVPGFAPFQPVPVFPNAFDFNSFYQGLQANFANAAATQSYATGGATAVASASQFSYPGFHYHYRVPPQHNQQYQQVPWQPQQQQRQRGHQQHSASSNSYYNNNNNNFGNGYSNYNDAYNLYQQQLAHQNALFNQIRQQQAFAANAGSGAGGGFSSGGNFAGPGYAGASAAYGPGGTHQTAHIYPENPQSPNVDVSNRFGGDAQQGGRPGFVGVSSFSSSSNINGQSHREASTTVNDNGKVTTYHVRS